MSGHSFGGYTTLAMGGADFNLDVVLQLCERPTPDQEEACAYSLSASERYQEGFGDPRLKALIPLTPAGANLFDNGQGLSAISAPTMLMTAALDATLPNLQEGDPLWSGLTQPNSVRIDFNRAGHFTFSNACEVASALLESDGCGPRFLPYEEAHALIKLYALAFAQQHVLNDPLMRPITRGEELPTNAVDQLTFSLRE
jgi:predicted dienelactone hydrolase